jgi:cytochrome o ubiquinol oxidase subunit 1
MIVSGVLFGYFAGYTYWFPKIFGFKLDERWGKRAFWCWFIGFILAFGPLYLLGFEGATRRLDHYAANLGWQPLFIVAGIGAVLIAVGFACQVAQLVASIRKRHENRDTTGDPWGGRTLEWSTSSPPPAYNFAALPIVHTRDQWWAEKQNRTQHTERYEDFTMPKHSAAGVVIGAFSFVLGFGAVWHIWWMLVLGLLGVAVTMLVRTFDEDTEVRVSASEIVHHEAGLHRISSATI